MVKIVSLNVRSLGNQTKRKKIFDFIAKQKSHIAFLQETHSDRNCESIWSSQWHGDMILAHGDTNARGVAVLMRKGLAKSIKKSYIDTNGRFS